MKSYFDILNENEFINESIFQDEDFIRALIKGIGYVTPIAFGLGAMGIESLVHKFKDWKKDIKLKKIIKRLSNDPEVVEFSKSKKPPKGGWSIFIDSKLNDDEKEYFGKVFKKHFNSEIYEKKEGHVSRKLKFDIDIESTNHAIDRLNRKDKDGKAAYDPIVFKEVNSVINKATPEIIDELVRDEKDINKDRFILQRISDGLTVVGSMNIGKDDSLNFVVITLYRGDEFRVGRNQSIIKI